MASVFPFAVGVLFSIAFHETTLAKHFYFFIGMLVFDLATTAINSTWIMKRLILKYISMKKNVIGRRNLSPCIDSKHDFSYDCICFVIGVILNDQYGLAFTFDGIYLFFYWSILYIRTDSFISGMPFRGNFQWGDYGPWNFAMVVYVNTFGSDVYDLTVNFSSGQFALVGNLLGAI